MILLFLIATNQSMGAVVTFRNLIDDSITKNDIVLQSPDSQNFIDSIKRIDPITILTDFQVYYNIVSDIDDQELSNLFYKTLEQNFLQFGYSHNSIRLKELYIQLEVLPKQNIHLSKMSLATQLMSVGEYEKSLNAFLEIVSSISNDEKSPIKLIPNILTK